MLNSPVEIKLYLNSVEELFRKNNVSFFHSLKLNEGAEEFIIENALASIGALLLIVGITAAVMSFDPSQVLRYIFIGMSVTIGLIAVSIGLQARNNFVRSKYYLWIGFILFALAISLSIWATTLVAFIIVLGFFLLALGIIEFDFAQQFSTTSRYPGRCSESS